MNKFTISKESQNRLWFGIHNFFSNHPNEFIHNYYTSHVEEEPFRQALIAAAAEVVYVAKIAAFSLRQPFDCRLVLRDAVNRGRVDHSLEAELKIYMINNFIDESVSKEQLDIILATPIQGKGMGKINQGNNNYSDKEIRRFREIVGQFKRDYITIFEDKEYMNNQNMPTE